MSGNEAGGTPVNEVSTSGAVSDGDAVVEPRSVLYEWKSDQRAFRRLNKKQFLLILAAVVIFMVALAILGHYWFMAALAALMFLLYAVGTIPPVKVSHVITNQAIETNNMKYEWEKLESYWFSERDGQKFLYIDTSIPFPGRLIILVDDDQLMNVHEVLKNRLKYEDRRGQSRYGSFLEGTWVDMLGGKVAAEKKGGVGERGKESAPKKK